MNILSIGNSFSTDSQRYLHQVAKSYNYDLTCVNPYIGGCSLEKHYHNILENENAYNLEFNGQRTGILVNLNQILSSLEWDVITIQQQSLASCDYKTFKPYLQKILEHVKKLCPNAKIFILQTWAYENDSPILLNTKYKTAFEMFNDIKKTYEQAKKDINADGIIPCGKVFETAVKLGISKIHRDTYHASYGAGRYALALTWLKTLFGCDVTEDKFNDFDEPVTEEERQIIIQKFAW